MSPSDFSCIYLEYGEFAELRDMVVPSRGDLNFVFYCAFVCFPISRCL